MYPMPSFKTAVHIGIFTPRRLNISDPGDGTGKDGYPDYTGINVYNPPLDIPSITVGPIQWRRPSGPMG